MTFKTHFKFAFLRSQKFTVQLVIALLSFSSPLLLCNSIWAQSVTREEISTQSQQKQNKTPENTETDLDNINTALEKFNSQDALFGDKNKAISVFKNYLKHPNKDVRINALNALSAIGTGADDALDYLKDMLKREKDPDVLSNVISTVQSISARFAISELINVFKDEQQDLRVRLSAATAIKTATNTKQVKELIPLLLNLLKDQNIDKTKLRISAAEILSYILHSFEVEQYPSSVLILISALEDPAWRVRKYAADTLGNIAFYAKSSVPELIKAYEKDRNYTMRKSAITALGNIGNISKVNNQDTLMILKVLRKALEENNDIVREGAADAVRKVAAKFEKVATTNRMKTKELNDAISELEEALKILEKLKPEKKSISLKTNIQNIQSSLEELQRRQVINEIIKNPSLWGIGTYLISLFGIFWLRPLWLLKIDKALKSVGTFKLPLIDKEISLSWLLLMLKYRPRVLDAWVQAHLKSAQDEFGQKNTVSDRNVYIPIPVVRKDKTIAEFTSEHLRSTFDKKRACLLIQGEGGVGKTSLACQIAKWAMSDDKSQLLCKHRMLPVLIEEELEISDDIEIEAGLERKSSFIVALIEAIQGQLQDLTDETEPVSKELLERLLRERRILVIVDHLSEMSEATRKAIRPESPDFPVNALVVTSRLEEKLGQVTKTTLKPLRIQGNRLSSFMEAYLTQANKRDLFTDPDFFQACSGLSQMVGERNITALLAKLYADQLIAAKVEGVQQVSLVTSDNIPELMLWYLNELNRGGEDKDNKLSDPTVQQDAKVIAWECVKHNFQPTTAQRNAVLASLQGEDAENRLTYLEKRLRLIQTIGAAQDKVRFALDPLAEYLAAMRFLELFLDNPRSIWKDFKDQVIRMEKEIESIKGFLVALHDNCQNLVKKNKKEGKAVPESVLFILKLFNESPLLNQSINPCSNKNPI